MASQRLHHNYELASRSWSGQEVWFWSSSQALLPQKLRGRGLLKYRSRLHQMVHNSWNLNVRSTRGVGMCLWNWPKTQSAKYGRCCRFGLPLGEAVFACLRERIDQHLPQENMFFVAWRWPRRKLLGGGCYLFHHLEEMCRSPWTSTMVDGPRRTTWPLAAYRWRDGETGTCITPLLSNDCWKNWSEWSWVQWLVVWNSFCFSIYWE